MLCLRRRIVSFVAVLVALCSPHGRPVAAQEVHTPPGVFDYYVLNMSWAPEFCHNVQALPDNERFNARRIDAADECSTPHGFVLHGLWPQNTNGTWPANCSKRAGLKDYTPFLKDTPSETLLRHEWSKHGTCTTLSPKTFFTTADHAFEAVHIPAVLQHVHHELQLKPNDIAAALDQANPNFPQGSVVLSCGRNYLTAINVCLSKSGLKPVACQNLRACGATVVKIAPERVQQH